MTSTRPRPAKRVLGPLALAGALLSGGAGAETVVGDGLVLSCSQPTTQELRCDYRLTRPGYPLAAVATVNDVVLPAPTFAARTGDPAGTAVLLLVDTSDPGRSPAVSAARDHLRTLLASAEPHQRFGLATFDSDLRLLAPIGSSTEQLEQSIGGLEASGRTTELYRSVVDALKLLDTATDEHKVLVVLSDGLAEDRAYFHDDAVRTALASRITIHAIGYPRSVPLSVGLQSLRRLADETGGRFVATTGNGFTVPQGTFDTPFIGIENAGALNVKLAGASELAGGTLRVRIGLETSAGLVQAVVPVTLPARIQAEPVVKVVEVEVPRVVEVERVVQVPATAPAPPEPRGARLPAAADAAGVPFWYWMVAIGVLALLLLAILALLLVRRRPEVLQKGSPIVEAPPVPMPGFASLTLDEEPDAPYTISAPTYRIGRLGDNDMVLRDPSVSRHHAELRRRRDGSFQIIDLDSMNGIIVNGKRVRDGELGHGDVVEVGDVRMVFGAAMTGELPGEETVILHTAMPDRLLSEVAGGRR